MTFDANLLVGVQIGVVVGFIVGALAGGVFTWIWVREQ